MDDLRWTCYAQVNHETEKMEVVAQNCTYDSKKALEDYYSNTLYLKFNSVQES